MIGEELGNYRVLAPIGKGGMASVFVGEHKLLGNQVAIKVLHKRHLDNPAIERRFFNEAKVIAAIRHPNIVEILDFGRSDDGAAYIVMELLEGQTLRNRIRRGIMPEHQSVIFMRQLASALAVAHKKGVIHRDLKPDNVFIIEDEEVELGERIKLLDFGIAKRIDPEMANGFPASEQTATGILVGTPAYMSPEQCKGLGNIDGRSDVYSLGVVLYRMLTNQLPFEAGGTGELIGKHLYVEPSTPRDVNPEISVGLEEVVMRCLEKEPDARYQTMGDLAIALDDMISSESTFHNRARRASASAVTEIAVATPSQERLAASVSPMPMPAPNVPDEISATTLRTATGERVSPIALGDDTSIRSRNWPWMAAAGCVAAMLIGVLAIGGGDDTTGETPTTAASPAPALSDAKPDPAPKATDRSGSTAGTSDNLEAERAARVAAAKEEAAKELAAKEAAARELAAKQEAAAKELAATREADQAARDQAAKNQAARNQAAAAKKAAKDKAAKEARALANRHAKRRDADARRAAAEKRREAARKAEAEKRRRAAKAAKAAKEDPPKKTPKKTFDDVKTKAKY